MVAGLMIKNPSVLQGLKLSNILLFKHLQKKEIHLHRLWIWPMQGYLFNENPLCNLLIMKIWPLSTDLIPNFPINTAPQLLHKLLNPPIVYSIHSYFVILTSICWNRKGWLQIFLSCIIVFIKVLVPPRPYVHKTNTTTMTTFKWIIKYCGIKLKYIFQALKQ